MTGLRSALVTGANGFIGSAVARRLAADGVETTCLVREGSPLGRLHGVPGVSVLPFDFRNLESLGRVLAGCRAEAVFNLASYGVRQEDRDSRTLLRVNVGFLACLLEVAAGWPLRAFLHAGSCFEYGSTGIDGRLGEDHPLRPSSLYGASKAASVLYGSALAASLGIPFAALRLFGVYGPGEDPQRLLPYLIGKLSAGQPAELTGGEQVRDLLYVEDAASAFVEAAAGLPGGDAGVFNVCSGVPVRIREVGESVAEALGSPRELLRWGARPYRPDEPMTLVGDNTRFVRAFPWRPRVDLREGVRRTAEAWRRDCSAARRGPGNEDV